MKVLRIDDQTPASSGIICRIESPAVGDFFSNHEFEVSGTTSGIEGAASLLLAVNGINLAKRELKPGQRDGERTFNIKQSCLGLPVEGELMMNAHTCDGRSIQLARITYRRHFKKLSFSPNLQPVMVTALGRSGTTRLMQLLGRHPVITGYDQYPYELRIAQYWMQAMHVMTAPASGHPQYHVDNFANRPFFGFVGPNPYYGGGQSSDGLVSKWHRKHMCPDIERLCMGSIENFYKKMALRQLKFKPRFFAEKFHPNFMPYLFRECYTEAREIFIVRDFRDMLASILAFNRKRGTCEFGRSKTSSDQEFIRTLANGPLRQLSQAWRSRGQQALLVKYEDLVLEPRQTLQSVFRHIDVSSRDHLLDKALSERNSEAGNFEKHTTSSSAESSVRKWEKALEPELQELCAHHFRDALDLFGY